MFVDLSRILQIEVAPERHPGPRLRLVLVLEERGTVVEYCFSSMFSCADLLKSVLAGGTTVSSSTTRTLTG